MTTEEKPRLVRRVARVLVLAGLLGAMLATPLYGEDYATAETRDVYLPSGQWMDFDSGKIYTGGQTLKGFPLPVGKTPLFLGGSGVTLEAINGVVRAVVYPVAIEASETMTLPESMQALTVNVRGLPIGTKWRGIRVMDGNNKKVPVAEQGFGFSFVPKPGEAYKVQALR
jgi:hypothetical protein